MKMHPIMKHIESTSEQPCRILIADDEPLVCELMQFNLEKEGFEVDVFRNVDEAYQADLPNYNLFIIVRPAMAKTTLSTASTRVPTIIF